jgi:DegV family protein with EDD domain
MPTAIVTDSTADIPSEIVKELNIHIVPNILIIDGKEYADGVDISRREFYEQLPILQIPPTTATASSGTYKRLFEELFGQGYNQIISIHVSESFSGVFNAVSVAAESFGSRIHVVDSQQVTLGLGFQVCEAAEAAQGDAPYEEILNRVKDIRSRVRVFAMLDTLEFLHRSGRVSWARARIGNLLRVKPFIEVKDGQANRLADVRTRRKGFERLLSLLKIQGPLEKLALLHSNAENEAKKLLEAYNTKIPSSPMIINVTTTIGTHVGPNGLGFAAVVKSH